MLSPEEMKANETRIKHLEMIQAVLHERNIKHLEMIQAVITRMANNSFLIKGWCVTLTSLDKIRLNG